MQNYAKILMLALATFCFTFTGYGQDVEEVNVTPKYNQSEAETIEDKNNCYANAEEQFDHSKHKTIKNTGAGAAGGGIVGKIIGIPGIGAVVGGAAGAVRGHKQSKQDKEEFNQLYTSCLIDKGYEVEIEED